MSSYFKRLISRRIVDIVKSRIKYKLPNEEKIVKGFNDGIALRVPQKSSQSIDTCTPRFRLLVTNPDTLQVSLPKDFYRKDAPRLQLKDLSDGLVTGFSLRKDRQPPGTYMPPQIMINVNEFEFRKIALNQILRERENYGYTSVRNEGNKQTVFMECPAAVSGPFHCIDLYSAILANAAANMYEAAGYKVIKCHFVCDSRPFFACLYQGLKEKGNIEQFNKSPVSHIYEICQEMASACRKNEIKKQIVKILREKILNEDKYVIADVKKLRDVISTEYKKMFERFGIQFTHTEWESVYQRQLQVGTFRNKLGNSFLPEMGVISLEDRYEKYQFDMMLYCGFITFSNIKTCIRNKSSWKFDSSLFDFVQEGTVRLSSLNLQWDILKQNESTEECLNSAKQRVMDALRSQRDPENTENIEDVTEVIANTCIIIQTILSTAKKYEYKGIYEDIENGIFLQTVHARLSQFLSLNANVNIDELLEVTDDSIKCLEEQAACRLILYMCWYEERFENSVIKRQPSFIAKYLLELGSCINVCLDTLTVKNQPDHIAFARIMLFTCAKIVFSNGLCLLGIKPLDKI